MHSEKLQHMIELLEDEARNAGYDYSAEFLKLAASSLRTEVALSDNITQIEKSSLECVDFLH